MDLLLQENNRNDFSAFIEAVLEKAQTLDTQTEALRLSESVARLMSQKMDSLIEHQDAPELYEKTRAAQESINITMHHLQGDIRLLLAKKTSRMPQRSELLEHIIEGLAFQQHGPHNEAKRLESWESLFAQIRLGKETWQNSIAELYGQDILLRLQHLSVEEADLETAETIILVRLHNLIQKHQKGQFATIEQVWDILEAFRDQRRWEQCHDMKNLLQRLVEEAAEAMGVMGWTTNAESQDYALQKQERLGQELADVHVFLQYAVHKIGIDLILATLQKILLNAERYPLGLARNNAESYKDRESK